MPTPPATSACRPNPFSSRACEWGTKTCTVRHGAPSSAEVERLALSTAAARLSQALDALAPIDTEVLHARAALHITGARASLRMALEDVEATRRAAGRVEG